MHANTGQYYNNVYIIYYRIVHLCIPIFCSNALKVGTCQLHLWPAFVQDEHSHDSHCPSPIAPAVNNPSTKAVVLTIRFDTSLTNIIFPEDIPSRLVKAEFSTTIITELKALLYILTLILPSFSDNVLEGLQNFYSAEDFQIKVSYTFF